MFERELVRPPGNEIRSCSRTPTSPRTRSRRASSSSAQQQKHARSRSRPGRRSRGTPTPMAPARPGDRQRGTGGGRKRGAGSDRQRAPAATGSARRSDRQRGAGSEPAARYRQDRQRAPAATARGAGGRCGQRERGGTGPPPLPPLEIAASRTCCRRSARRQGQESTGSAPRHASPDARPRRRQGESDRRAVSIELSSGNLARRSTRVRTAATSSSAIVRSQPRSRTRQEPLTPRSPMQERGQGRASRTCSSGARDASPSRQDPAGPDRIRESDAKGNPAPTVYHPCNCT